MVKVFKKTLGKIIERDLNYCDYYLHTTSSKVSFLLSKNQGKKQITLSVTFGSFFAYSICARKT